MKYIIAIIVVCLGIFLIQYNKKPKLEEIFQAIDKHIEKNPLHIEDFIFSGSENIISEILKLPINEAKTSYKPKKRYDDLIGFWKGSIDDETYVVMNIDTHGDNLIGYIAKYNFFSTEEAIKHKLYYISSTTKNNYKMYTLEISGSIMATIEENILHLALRESLSDKILEVPEQHFLYGIKTLEKITR